MIDQFKLAIEKAGQEAPDTVIDDGAIHRYATNGKTSDKAGWYP
jgi:hypothetical protein